MKKLFCLAGMISALPAFSLRAERINQEGRLLGVMPAVNNPVLFNTTEADAVVSAMQILPITNPWNEDISRRPLLANSDAMIAQIMTNLSANHRNLAAEYEMNFVLVPDNLPRVPINFFNYPDESDLEGGTSPYGSYPIPTNLPIETWPFPNPDTLMQWQTNNDGSDRHAIMVAPGAGLIWETWLTSRVGTNWQASNGAKFDLKSNGLRTDGWTSGDAAGLPLFPAVVRYDEAERGMVEHACRLVVAKSRYQNYLYPATHFAAPAANTSTNLPAMGQRLRLKSAFVIATNWTQEEKSLLLGLKKYGAIVADNGSVFSISVTPDNRWPTNCFIDLASVSITNFEVIQTTGPNQGPRSVGAPGAAAGVDQTIEFGQTAALAGTVNYSNNPPIIQWKVYAGPGTVTFANAAQTNTTVNFSIPGRYVLELSADDQVHAVAYAIVTITVTNVIHLGITRVGGSINLSWTGGVAPYIVQQNRALTASGWSNLATTSAMSTNFPVAATTAFYRVIGQ